MLTSVSQSLSSVQTGGNQHSPNSPQLQIYSRPRLLSSELDRDLSLDFQQGNYQFAKQTNSFLLATSEFESASADYPIVFVGNREHGCVPTVVVGLFNQNNAMVNEQGQWKAGVYVPAFVRRYPFVMMEQPDKQLCVGIDAAYAGWGSQGNRLFKDDGSHTDLLEHATRFLTDFHQHMLATQEFCRALQAHDLLVDRFVEISGGPQVPPRSLRDFYVIDRARLHQLPDELLLRWARGPELSWVHAHLASLSQFKRLLNSHSSLPAVTLH